MATCNCKIHMTSTEHTHTTLCCVHTVWHGKCCYRRSLAKEILSSDGKYWNRRNTYGISTFQIGSICMLYSEWFSEKELEHLPQLIVSTSTEPNGERVISFTRSTVTQSHEVGPQNVALDTSQSRCWPPASFVWTGVRSITLCAPGPSSIKWG